MALSSGLRSSMKLLTSSESTLLKSVPTRSFHSTGVRMGGYADGHGGEPEYVHAKHMYNLDKVRHRKVVFPLAVFTAFSIGVGVPIYAVIFQQKKAASS